MKQTLRCTIMGHKARWGVTLGTGTFFCAGLLAEFFGDTMTRTLECMGSSPIAAMAAVANALTMVP
jgi:uncharacterized PurR-regulated membrane protein YhhQ (DUF165 family)